MRVGKSIVFDSKIGMRKFWDVALPFGKVACAVKVSLVVNLGRFSNIIRDAFSRSISAYNKALTPRLRSVINTL